MKYNTEGKGSTKMAGKIEKKQTFWHSHNATHVDKL
jgi:hypothetical protein